MRNLPVVTAALFLATASLGAMAQTPAVQDHTTHHPGPTTAQAPVTAPPQGGMGGMMRGGMGGMMQGGMMQGGMGGMMPTMHLQHVEGRIAVLKAEIKITPTQEPRWNNFSEAVRSAARKSQAVMQPMMTMRAGTPSTAPEHLVHHEMMLTSQLDAVRTIKVAFEPLYATLSDEQKKLADQLLHGPMGIF
jgi:predicted lipid-binding transport protein (Tim44 family)